MIKANLLRQPFPAETLPEKMARRATTNGLKTKRMPKQEQILRKTQQKAQARLYALTSIFAKYCTKFAAAFGGRDFSDRLTGEPFRLARRGAKEPEKRIISREGYLWCPAE